MNLIADFGKKSPDGNSMQMEKISISLPPPLVQFVENYKIIRVRKSSSQVIKLALDLLQYQELKQA